MSCCGIDQGYLPNGRDSAQLERNRLRETAMTTDATLDLVLERYVDVPVEQVWAAWTQPSLLVQWFSTALA